MGGVTEETVCEHRHAVERRKNTYDPEIRCEIVTILWRFCLRCGEKIT